MTGFQEQESVVGQAGTTDAPDGLAGGTPRPRPAKVMAQRRERLPEGLARRIVARLPLAVAVINADLTLSFWNEQASVMFGAPPQLAAERPALAEMLARVGHLTQPQRERIVAFAMAHIAAGDRVEPDGSLRLSLDRGRGVVIQVHGLGDGRWMLVFDDGKTAGATVPAAPGSKDAWLDTLTGLSNRRHFDAMLQQVAEDVTSDRRQAALLIDLDHFARVNQRLGLPVGDALLCLVAQRLRGEARDDDVLARLGGDKFAMLLPNRDGAESLAARSIEILAQPFLVEGHLVSISASVGLVRIPEHGSSADALMHHADIALHRAKSTGGRTWCLFDAEMLNEARDRRELENDLRQALAQNELSLAYQPCGQGRGLEARPRWDHPRRGLVPASVVMRLAEACGIVPALGQWQLRAACAAAATWPESPPRHSPPVVVVGLTARQLQDPDGVEASVRLALAESGLPPRRLALKIPAASVANGGAEPLATLHRLRALGVGIEVPDGADGGLIAATLPPFPVNGEVNAGNPAGAGQTTALGYHPHIGSKSASGGAEVLHRHALLSNPDPTTE